MSNNTVFSRDNYPDTSYGMNDAEFGNHFIKFVESDFKPSLFTHKFYDKLSCSFDHIAHFNKDGFYEEWFSTTKKKRDFIRFTIGGGDFSRRDSIEWGIAEWLLNHNYEEIYRNKVKEEKEHKERELLTRLKAKYES